MNLQELKNKEPEELLKQADKLEIETPSSFRKQDLMFTILKQIAFDGSSITGLGILEIMQDGFGFLRSPESNYLPGPDDIYVSPNQIKKLSLRTGLIQNFLSGEQYPNYLVTTNTLGLFTLHQRLIHHLKMHKNT